MIFAFYLWVREWVNQFMSIIDGVGVHEVLIRISNRLQKSSPFLTHSPIYSRHRKSAKKNWFVSSASFDVKERLDFQLSSSFLFFFHTLFLCPELFLIHRPKESPRGRICARRDYGGSIEVSRSCKWVQHWSRHTWSNIVSQSVWGRGRGGISLPAERLGFNRCERIWLPASVSVYRSLGPNEAFAPLNTIQYHRV